MSPAGTTWFVVVKDTDLPRGALIRVQPGAQVSVALVQGTVIQPIDLTYARLEEELTAGIVMAITEAEAALLNPSILPASDLTL